MAFESVQIQSLRNGSGLTVGARADLAASDVMALSLTNTVGVTSFKWELFGRPEGSTAAAYTFFHADCSACPGMGISMA